MARIQGFLEAYDYTEYNMGIMDITFAKLSVLLVIVLIAIFVIPRFAPDIKLDRAKAASPTGAVS